PFLMFELCALLSSRRALRRDLTATLLKDELGVVRRRKHLNPHLNGKVAVLPGAKEIVARIVARVTGDVVNRDVRAVVHERADLGGRWSPPDPRAPEPKDQLPAASTGQTARVLCDAMVCAGEPMELVGGAALLLVGQFGERRDHRR